MPATNDDSFQESLGKLIRRGDDLLVPSRNSLRIFEVAARHPSSVGTGPVRDAGSSQVSGNGLGDGLGVTLFQRLLWRSLDDVTARFGAGPCAPVNVGAQQCLAIDRGAVPT